jgi:Flp pilus assembly protein TadD
VAAHGNDQVTARRMMERALGLAPMDDQLLLQAGLMAMRQQDLAAAQSYFDRAAAAAPTNPDVWAQLIELHTARNDFAAAGRALATGLANCPRSPGLRLQLARRLAAAGRTDEAIAQFRESFRLRPEEADPLIEIAQLEFQRERVEPALLELRHALEVSPGHPVALPTLALHAIATGDERAARQWLRQCADQVRIPPEQLAQLRTQFAGQFGHAPD